MGRGGRMCLPVVRLDWYVLVGVRLNLETQRVIWPLTLGPFALRRLIRRRRGLCLACGYDLRHTEHEACPECGVTA